MRYKGKNIIDFSCDEQKNVTVILGDNTSGKTTVAQAFRYALYGEIEVALGKKREDYLLLNREIADNLSANAKGTMSVELRILQEISEGEYVDDGEKEDTFELKTQHIKTKEYILKREEWYSRRGNGTNNFNTVQSVSLRCKNQGEPDEAAEIINEREIENTINEMLPRELSMFFLFDGEKWNDPFAKRGSQAGQLQKSIKDSIHIFTGLSGTKAALEHLNEMGSNSVIKTMKRNIKNDGAIYQSIQADIDRLYAQMEKITKTLPSYKVQIQNYEKMIEEKERYLEENRSTQDMQRELMRIKGRIHDKEELHRQCTKQLIQVWSEHGYQYFAMPLTKLCGELMEQHKLDKKDIPDIRQRTIDFLIKQGKCLCGCEIMEQNAAYQNLMELRQFLPPADMGSLIGEMQRTARRWENEQSNFSQKILENGTKIAKIQEEMQELKWEWSEKEKLAESNIDFKTVKEEKNHLQKQKQEMERQLWAVQQNVESIKKSIAQKEKDLESMQARNAENLMWSQRVAIAEQLYNYLQVNYTKREAEIFRRLNQIIKENFAKMFRASDKFLELDKNYEMHLYYKHFQANREETNLSEGEKVARNFAFIASIMEYNRERKELDWGEKGEFLPIILDGPFSKLGSENIGLISQRLPIISEQVILFMLEKDWKHVQMHEYVDSDYQYIIEKKENEVSAAIVKYKEEK